MLHLVITDPFPPGVHLGPLQFRFYGLAYAIAFLVGGWVATRHLARRSVLSSVSQNIAFWAIVFGLVGARLYYVVQSGWWWYLTHPVHILAIWEGGMAFFGAIFAVVIVLFVMSRRHHIEFADLLDAGVLFAAVGQPIGRLGNFMNGEILGPPSNLPWAVRYTSPDSSPTEQRRRRIAFLRPLGVVFGVFRVIGLAGDAHAESFLVGRSPRPHSWLAFVYRTGRSGHAGQPLVFGASSRDEGCQQHDRVLKTRSGRQVRESAP